MIGLFTFPGLYDPVFGTCEKCHWVRQGKVPVCPWGK